MSKQPVSRLRLGRQGLLKMLGSLEAEIMEVLWQKKKGTVGDVWQVLHRQRGIAYDTVRTVMNRLADKGLLRRETGGRAYLYEVVVAKSELTQRTVEQVLDELLSDFAEPAMSHLVDHLSPEDEERILALSKLIQERRRQKQGEG